MGTGPNALSRISGRNLGSASVGGFWAGSGTESQNADVVSDNGFYFSSTPEARYLCSPVLVQTSGAEGTHLWVSNVGVALLQTGELNDTIYVIGNPRGLVGTFSDEAVSSIRKADSDSLIQVTAQVSPVSSGGPVLVKAKHRRNHNCKTPKGVYWFLE